VFSAKAELTGRAAKLCSKALTEQLKALPMPLLLLLSSGAAATAAAAAAAALLYPAEAGLTGKAAKLLPSTQPSHNCPCCSALALLPGSVLYVLQRLA
jgi:hypothetical protein